MSIYRSSEKETFKELVRHLEHDIEVVDYTDNANEICNIAIECNTCEEVLVDIDNPDWVNPDIDTEICEKCGEIHNVEEAGGHDLIEAQKVLECECSEHPDDEFCKQVFKNKE